MSGVECEEKSESLVRKECGVLGINSTILTVAAGASFIYAHQSSEAYVEILLSPSGSRATRVLPVSTPQKA